MADEGQPKVLEGGTQPSRVTSQIIINIRDDGKCEASWTNVDGLVVLMRMMNYAVQLYTEHAMKKGGVKL